MGGSYSYSKLLVTAFKLHFLPMILAFTDLVLVCVCALEHAHGNQRTTCGNSSLIDCLGLRD